MPTEVLFHVDILITCAAPPDVEVPEPFRGPKFNMLLARGARLIGPRLAFTVLFEVNAGDEDEAKLKAADAVKEVLDSLDRQKPEDKMLPDELDLHEDRIVVAGLAVRRVAGVPDAGAGMMWKTQRRALRMATIVAPVVYRWARQRQRQRRAMRA